MFLLSWGMDTNGIVKGNDDYLGVCQSNIKWLREQLSANDSDWTHRETSLYILETLNLLADVKLVKTLATEGFHFIVGTGGGIALSVI